MVKKKIIFDVSIILEDVEVYELRFKELYQHVDYFLIFGTESCLRQIEKFYGVIDQKIITFPLTENFSPSKYDDKFISFSILQTLEKLHNTFDDRIIFSYSNEIPSLNLLTEYDFKINEILFLKSEVFECDFSKKRKFPEQSSIITSFSYILKNKNGFLSSFINYKTRPISNDVVFHNGYKIIDYKKNLSEAPTSYFCPISKKMVEYKCERSLRKYIFIFNDSSKEVDGDYIFRVKFSNRFPEKLKIDLFSREQNLEIYLPEIILYCEDSEKFIHYYKINEISRILSNFNCQNDDQIEIHFSDDRLIWFKYSEIKNPSI